MKRRDDFELPPELEAEMARALRPEWLTLFFMATIVAAVGLLRAEHPTIPTTDPFGEPVWAGWVMIAVLAYSAIPPLVLGRMRTGATGWLHDKTPKADADMSRADWLTATAGIAGILGVGLGWWWADGAAAGLISIDIVKDGLTNLSRCVADLMGQRPTTVDGHPADVSDRVAAALRDLPWVQTVAVRVREEGHLFAGEAFVVPDSDHDAVRRIAEAVAAARRVDWRVQDFVVTLVVSSRRGTDRRHGCCDRALRQTPRPRSRWTPRPGRAYRRA